MPDHPESTRRSAETGLTIAKSALKLALLVGVVVLAASFVFNAGVQLDRQGLDAYEDGDPLVGAWLGDWPSDERLLIEDFERTTGVELDMVDVFLDWRTPVDNVTHTIAHIADRGALPILSWEPQTITTQDILDGTRTLDLRDGRMVPLDEYLNEFAEGVCRTAGTAQVPVFLRTMHEMNGDWFAWGIGYTDSEGNEPNTEASYKQAWVKIHDAFTSRCVGDVKFVWAVNHHSGGDRADFTGTYPGDAYVDVVGLDGYNWGGNAPWGWQSFEELFNPAYCAVTGATARPVWIAETGSTERGGNKADWIRDLFQRVDSAAYPRLQGVVWLHHAKFEREIGGQMDWQVTSSPAAMAAFSEEAEALQAVRHGDERATVPASQGPDC